MRQDERDLERRCIDYARQHGWDCWKNENNGNTGIPDHSLLKGCRFVMVEFKRSSTARIRPEQIRWKERHPETIYFVHDFETFTKILEKMSNTTGTTSLFHEFRKQELSDRENEVTINGKTYHAKPRHEKQEGGIRHHLCCECAMMSLRKFHNIQNACSLVKCMADERMDKTSVIFS